MTENKIKYPFLDLGRVNEPFLPAIRRAVERVLADGRYIGGNEVEAFERELAAFTGTRHAVGTSNGLDAIRLILRAYMEMGRLKAGDEVIVPSNTFIASVLPVTDCGLTPRFAEPDPSTHNLDPEAVEAAIGPRTRAIITVHLYGRISYSERLAETAKKHGLLLIEDSAQAIGAISAVAGPGGSRRAGALGDAAAFSFYPTKNTGALGDAGAVTTDDDELARTVRMLRNYGSEHSYHHEMSGLNCRLDSIQAAILREKLPMTDAENAARRATAAVYGSEIQNSHVILPADTGSDCVWHQYVVRVADRDGFRRFLLDRGVETSVHYPVPPHRQPCYKDYAGLALPVADRLASEVVSLPIAPRCTGTDDAREIAAIINSYRPQ